MAKYDVKAKETNAARALPAQREEEIRFSSDGSISMVYRAGEPVRCPTQDDLDTLPVGSDMTADEIECLES